MTYEDGAQSRGRTGMVLPPRDFRHTSVFTASYYCLCAGLSLDHHHHVLRSRPSSLYTFLFTRLRSGLPSALPVKVSPNLSGFTLAVSELGAQVVNPSPLRLPISPSGLERMSRQNHYIHMIIGEINLFFFILPKTLVVFIGD